MHLHAVLTFVLAKNVLVQPELEREQLSVSNEHSALPGRPFAAAMIP
jgi:hypothetical protein